MSVYGKEGELGRPVVIVADTACHPTTLYGKSKLEAEKLLLSLQDENFAVTIVRPPMIYGPRCPGNYARLRKLVLHLGIFPKIDNKRSMIFIDNLCYSLEQAIAQTTTGVLLPQNPEYVSTSELIRLIGEQHGKRVLFSRVMGLAVRFIPIGAVKKLYGNLVYEIQVSEQSPEPQVVDKSWQEQHNSPLIGLEESIKISEMEWEKN
jgi:UDP-glucose 4-epimerase